MLIVGLRYTIGELARQLRDISGVARLGLWRTFLTTNDLFEGGHEDDLGIAHMRKQVQGG